MILESNLRVLAIVPSFPAPSETFIERKVSGLTADGVAISVLATRVKPGTYCFPVASFTNARWFAMGRRPQRCLQILVASLGQFDSRQRDIRAAAMAISLLAKKVDILHFEFSGMGVICLDALRLLPNLPIVVSCRGAAEEIAPLVKLDRVEHLVSLFSRAAVIHCVSDNMARVVSELGAPLAKIVVNRPAVDPMRYRRRTIYQARHPARILSVGRLHWKKGYDVALLALHRVASQGHSLRYEIIGDGPEREKLLYLVHKLGLRDSVVFHGVQSPQFVRTELEEASMFLLPSISEGISNSVLEAMSMEVPVVATTAGGMSEVIHQGVNGFLAPPLEVSALAGAVIRCLTHVDLLSIGQAGRRRIQDAFTLDRQVAVFRDIYVKAVKGG